MPAVRAAGAVMRRPGHRPRNKPRRPCRPRLRCGARAGPGDDARTYGSIHVSLGARVRAPRRGYGRELDVSAELMRVWPILGVWLLRAGFEFVVFDGILPSVPLSCAAL